MEEPNIRRSLLQTGLPLTRNELDQGVVRDNVWENRVALKFNDPSFTVTLPLYRRIRDVYPRPTPLAYRSGTKLLTTFNRVKANFPEPIRAGGFRV